MDCDIIDGFAGMITSSTIFSSVSSCVTKSVGDGIFVIGVSCSWVLFSSCGGCASGVWWVV